MMNGIKLAGATALVCLSCVALAQVSQPVGYISAASTNSTLVKTGPGQVTAITGSNITTSPYYLKLYDKATAPTCGTDTPVWRVLIPSNATSGATVTLGIPFPVSFLAGIGFCITAGYANADTASAAAGLTVNFGIK